MREDCYIGGSTAGALAPRDLPALPSEDGPDRRALAAFDGIFDDSVGGHGGNRLVVLPPEFCAGFGEYAAAFLCAVEIRLRFAPFAEAAAGGRTDLRMIVAEAAYRAPAPLPAPASLLGVFLSRPLRPHLLMFLERSRADRSFGGRVVTAAALFRSLRDAPEVAPGLLEVEIAPTPGTGGKG
ncbi:MAG: hypothetical protein ACU0DK_14065 [Pseudooceanicola sp.]